MEKPSHSSDFHNTARKGIVGTKWNPQIPRILGETTIFLRLL